MNGVQVTEIASNLVEVSGRCPRVRPTTGASRRTMTMPASFMAELGDYLGRYAAQTYVFPIPTADACGPSSDGA